MLQAHSNSAIHLHYVGAQINSPNPTLAGAYATITAELDLAVNVVFMITSSLRPLMAVYEDEQGLAYTDDRFKGAEAKHVL
jgi:hypothetical protein